MEIFKKVDGNIRGGKFPGGSFPDTLKMLFEIFAQRKMSVFLFFKKTILKQLGIYIEPFL